ncbi:MAG: hypothetical protein ACKVUS_12670 [Saprospiraceae bacterium]
MTATLEARKLHIIDLLVGVQNDRLIHLIETLLVSEEDFWNELSETQKRKIERAISDLDSGKGIPHEAVMQDFRQRYAQ